MKDLIIVGASGHGKEIAFLVDQINRTAPTWNLLGFLDDAPERRLEPCLGRPVLGGVEWLAAHPSVACALGVGQSASRRRVVLRLAGLGVDYPPLVHPSVIRAESCSIAEGAIVFAGAVLSVETRLERHVFVSWSATLAHGCHLGEYSSVYPGARVSGDVILEPGVTIGTGASIVQGRRIGANTFVGAGATVVTDLPADVVAVGTPARPIKEVR